MQATTQWRTKKMSLVESGSLHPVFINTADENARNALRHVQGGTKEPFYYEPLLFESWLHDVAKLADRVLAYRREGRDLEILAFKAAMDYELGQRTIANDRDTQNLLVEKFVKVRARETQDAAAKAFETTGPSQAGFRALAAGRGVELSIEIDEADQRLSLIKEKWEVQNEYQKSYWEKNNEPGNALNYAERAERVYRLLGEDLAEAYAKAIAIREGITNVHGKQLPEIPAIEA